MSYGCISLFLQPCEKEHCNLFYNPDDIMMVSCVSQFLWHKFFFYINITLYMKYVHKIHNAANSNYIFTLNLCGSHQKLQYLFRTVLVEKKHRHYSWQKYMTVWILNVSCDFHFWSWKKFLLFIHPNDGHVVKYSDYMLENYVMNYTDFPSTLWADFSSSTMQITTAASPSIPNLASHFILQAQTYTSMCTGIKTCGVSHIWNIGTNIWGEDKICWIKDV